MSTPSAKASRHSNLDDTAIGIIGSASKSSFDAATFFEKFELLADTPESVDKFRQTVLHFAFRGLLTERNGECRDEELLEKVESDVNVRGGKKRSRSKRQIVEPTSWPYDLPETWHWTILGRIANWGSGSTPKRGNPEFYGGTTTWLKSGELNDARDLIGSEEKVTDVALKQCSFRLNQKGDVLFAMYGATVGKVAILAEEAVTNQAVCGCTPCKFVNNVFLYYYLISQRQTFRDTSEGGAQPNFSKDKIVSFPFPLPPLAEQKRIVAKVDELMGLCDRLSALEAERKKRHASVSRAALARFANSPTPTNLELLFHKSFDVESGELRKSILLLATCGKLVEPDSVDAAVPASAIADRRSALCKLGQIKSLKPWTDFEGLDRMIHPLPPSWQWIRLGEIADIVRGGSPRPAGDPKFYNGKIPFLKVADVTRAKTRYVEDFTYTIKEAGLKKTRFIDQRTVLLTNSGATLGVPGICTITTTFNDGIAAFNYLDEAVYDEYLYFYLLKLSKWFMDVASRGQGQPNLNTDIIRSTWLALPPLAEQKRIVAKVDELMALVDQLEQQLAHSRTLGQDLLDAVVHELTSNNG